MRGRSTLEQDGRSSPSWEHVGTIIMDYTERYFHFSFSPPHTGGPGASCRPFENLACPSKCQGCIKREQRARSVSTVMHPSYCKGEGWEEGGVVVVDYWWKIASSEYPCFCPTRDIFTVQFPSLNCFCQRGFKMPGLLTVRGNVDCAEQIKLPGQHRHRRERIQVREMEGCRPQGNHHFRSQERKQYLTQNLKTT